MFHLSGLDFRGGSKKWFWIGTLATALIQTTPAPVASETLLQLEAAALNHTRLADQQGGFFTDSGLLVKFSFQDVLKVDGEVHGHTKIDIPRFDLLTPRAGGETAAPPPAEITRLTQIGPGNHVQWEMPGGNQGIQTIIQNTLNDKLIEYQKVLDVEISRFNFPGHTWVNARITDRLIEALK